MRHRRLGHSDLVVSEVGFGTWTLVTDWWGRTDDPH
ncbi:MAG TPA: aldo/keto reductase, partial [Acidimicrobiia bacterium]